MKALIVVVEDDPDLLELLEYKLAREGFDVIGFLNTKNVRRTLTEEPVDLIIMDRNLPDVEGSEYISMLRDQDMNIPVIFLSAKESNQDVKEGFMRGGDDYITKPFDMEELMLRIQAILKRTKPEQTPSVITFRDISLDLNTREATIASNRIELTKLEFELLLTLIEHQPKVLKRDYLLKHVWGKNEMYQGRTVNVAVNRLKEKIDPNKSKDYIKTVRGIGYTIH